MSRRLHPKLKLLLLGLLFVSLTLLGIGWAMRSSGASLSSASKLLELPTATLLLAAALSLSVLISDLARFWLASRTVRHPISWRACTDAAIANIFFAWITPGSAMAEPATIYAMTRHKIPVDAAATITFVKTIVSVTILMTLAFTIMVTGYGPDLPWYLYSPFASGTGVFAGILFVFWWGVRYPHHIVPRLARLADAVSAKSQGRAPRLERAAASLHTHTEATLKRMARYHEYSRANFLALALASTLHHLCFVGVLVTLGVALGAISATRLGALGIVYQTFTYMAPTPGGAGLSEASAQVFFQGVIQPQEAILMVTAYRTMTFYAQILIGLIYLPMIGALSGVLATAQDPPLEETG